MAKAGAQDYLLKGLSDSELVGVIRKVHCGLRYLPEDARQSLANRPPKSDLNERELQILQLTVNGLSNKGIGDALGITETTVKWDVNIILSRLHVTSVPLPG